MLWRPGPESTRSTLTCPTSAARNRHSAPCSVVLGRPVGVAGLRGDRTVVPAVPHEPGLAEARPRGDHGRIPRRRPPTGLEDGEVAVRQRRESPRVRLEVVDQDHALQTQARGERAGVHAPGQVGRHDATLLDRPGDPDARVRERPRHLAQERRHDLVETRVALAGIGTSDARHQAAPGDLEPRQAGVRAADVAGEDHGRPSGPTAGRPPVTIGLTGARTRRGQSAVYQRRPSCRMSSSAASGPHDPAA